MLAAPDVLQLPLPLLSPAQAAHRLGLSLSTLAKLRQPSAGDRAIPYRKLGSAVRYAPADVESWLERQPRRLSTVGA